MFVEPTYRLQNGIEIPRLGLGTWCIEQKNAAKAVQHALDLGYRHIDTAQAYENEAGVGAGIKNSGIPRENIFVTSKVAAELKSYDDAARSIDETLSQMGLDYLDLMLIHSPQPWDEWRHPEKRYIAENKAVWQALEAAYQAGKLKAIGVSNFLISDLEFLFETCHIRPMVNQILLHIGNTPFELLKFCQQHQIVVEAYSPIAHGEAGKSAAIVAMAEKYQVSVAQLCIRYAWQLNTVVLPKAENPAHMKNNQELDFTISADDMATLKAIRFTDYGTFSHFKVFSGRF
ncbi:aldo/keto reductase [Dichelobacter nodosus]|uniref:aldo/keto reductase n=1 Tax=Dichelobacter nodosus TaxID=870 RepID=UPI00107E678D|nr:aldo/keto reductase [Dichelobacter nodosus]TGA66320.1 aldo/keto reductase [Dichelobacter nodosus]